MGSFSFFMENYGKERKANHYQNHFIVIMGNAQRAQIEDNVKIKFGKSRPDSLTHFILPSVNNNSKKKNR